MGSKVGSRDARIEEKPGFLENNRLNLGKLIRYGNFIVSSIVDYYRKGLQPPLNANYLF